MNYLEKPSKLPIAFTLGVNVIVIFLLFLWLSNTRNIDGDEGLYLEAARLVSQGKRLYFDFFFQQMPLTPYLYAGWMKIFGFTLFSARALSAFLTALTGLAVLAYVARRTRALWILNITALLFIANGMILAWAPVVKTHPLTMLGLTASCVLLLEWKRSQKAWMLGAAALALGVGINGRLTLGPILLYDLAFIWIFSGRKCVLNACLFAGAVALVSLPTFYAFFADPRLFLKFNLKYHTEVYPGIVSAARRLYTAENLMRQAQFLLLVIGVQASVLLYARRKWRDFWESDESYLFGLILLYLAVHFASAEPYTQYFVALIPLMILAFVPVLQRMQDFPRWISVSVLVPALCVYLFNARAGMDFEIASMLSDQPEWRVASVRRTVGKLKQVLRKGDTCLTWWPGFAFMGGCASAPGMENHMRSYAVQRLPEEIVRSYKMMSDEELLQAVRERRYRVIVDSLYHIDSPYYEDIRVAMAGNYWHVGYGVKVRAPRWFSALADKN